MYITYNKLQEPYGEKLDQLFQRKNCLIEVNPGRVLLPEKFKDIAEQIRDFKIRKSDVWLISYPRTGEIYLNTYIFKNIKLYILLVIAYRYCTDFTSKAGSCKFT